MRRLAFSTGLVGTALATLALLSACSVSYPRRSPIGEVFPTVRGSSLAGETVTLPDVGRGAPLLLLVGYEQNTQFDLDRWLLGLAEAGVSVKAFEVPTIPGLVPGMIKGTIDGGMRRGIPSEDWGAVVTVYEDAAKIAAFTGNEDALPGRILLLDASGKVVFFHDRGYSVGTLRRLRQALASLE